MTVVAVNVTIVLVYCYQPGHQGTREPGTIALWVNRGLGPKIQRFISAVISPLCLRPRDSVPIILSHWHNLSMHTVENKPDMKL